jgi:hypothetical protein
MEKIEDIRPTAELSPEMIKTICDAISQEFYNWEMKEDDHRKKSLDLHDEEGSNKHIN